MNHWIINNLPYIYFEISDYQDYQPKEVLLENFLIGNFHKIQLVQKLLWYDKKLLDKTSKKLEFMYESLKNLQNPFLIFEIREFLDESDIKFLLSLIEQAEMNEIILLMESL